MGVELRQDLDMDDGDVFTDYDLALHVKDVLLSVSSGDAVSVENYRELVLSLYNQPERQSPDDVAKLVASLKGLSGAACYIDSAVHVGLLSKIFLMSLWNHGPDVMDALIELIISLAASSGKYLDLCLGMLTGHFETPSRFLEKLKLPYGLTKKNQVLSRVHSALNDIAEVVPLSPRRIVTIVSDHLERYRKNKSTSTHGLVIFVENMLKLEGGALGEVVRVSMLTKVVELLLHLDVEMGSWDRVLQDNGIFQMELEDVDDYTEDCLNDGTEAGEATLNGVTLKSFAEKLDTLMLLTFEHLESCESSGRLSEVFKTLLEVFRNKVLTTCKSKFVQFVMFYACALDPVNCGEEFATNLVEIFVYNGNQTSLRMRAVSYLASYLSRAMFVSASVVSQMLKRLVDWCFNFVKTKKGGVNPENDKLYYAACQAIMYLLCFRMRSLMDDPQSKSLLAGLPLESILTTEISPLKACVPSIVKEFLWQANAAGLITAEELDFDDDLESEYSLVWGGNEELHKLFPFDPCLLKNSDRFIRPNYIYWSMVQRTYDEDKEGSSDEDGDEAFAVDNEENVMDYEVLQCSEEQQFDEVDDALTKMSITPKDSLHSRFGGSRNKPLRMPSRIRPSTSPESL